MTAPSSIPVPAAPGLSRLQEIVLSDSHAALLAAAARDSMGGAAWRHRKAAEAHCVLALSQIAPRLTVMSLDMMDPLRVLVSMRCAVPTLPDPSGALEVARDVLLGITWPAEALSQRLPGYAFVQAIAPRIWHPNVGPPAVPIQRVCLGSSLPAGVRVSEILLMCFGALTLQTVQLDPRDSAGVLNPLAAMWWQQHTHLIPLSRVPFLGTADLSSSSHGGSS